MKITKIKLDKSRWHSILIITVFSVICFSAMAQNLQFRAEGLTGATWKSVKGTAEMYSTHNDGEYWTLSEKSSNVVWYGYDGIGKVKSSHEFPNTDSNKVSYIMAVVYIDGTAPLMTLVSAPTPLRLEPETTSVFKRTDTQTERNIAVSFRGMTNTVFVNGVETAKIAPGNSPVIIECEFHTPIMRRQMYFGGSAAFNRPWLGGIKELILLEEPPTDRLRNALRRYAALRHNVPLKTEPEGGVESVLTSAGINSAGLFNTIVIIR